MTYRFEITQPPGDTVVASGEFPTLDGAISEGGHYHRVYAQDGRCRLTVYGEGGEVWLMASMGRDK